MATLITHYEVYSGGANNVTLTTPSFTPTNGEVIICKLNTWDTANGMAAPTGGSQTFVACPGAVAPGGFNGWVGIWACTISGSPGSMTVSAAPATAGNTQHAMVVERWSSAKLAATPANTNGTGVNSLPQLSLTTTAANSVISWVISDAQSIDPATRAYLLSGVEDGLFDGHVGSNGVFYFAYSGAGAVTTATSYTYGLSAPGGQTWVMAGVEIQDNTPPAGATANPWGQSGPGRVSPTGRWATQQFPDTATVGPATLTRTAADTAQAVDSASASVVLARTAGNTAQAVDAASRMLVVARSATDTAQASDAATRAGAAARTASDSALASDAATRSVVEARTAADTAQAGDTATRVVVQARTASDTAAASDTTTRTLTAARTAGDTAAAADTATRAALAVARTAADAAQATDAATRTVALPRAPTDTAAASDTAVRAFVSARSGSDTAQASDTAPRSLTLARTATDTAVASDGATAVTGGGLLRTATDTATATDATARQVVAARSAADQAQAADSLARAAVTARAATEAAAASDSTSRVTATARAASDVTTSADTAMGSFAAARSAADTALAADVATVQGAASTTVLLTFGSPVAKWALVISAALARRFAPPSTKWVFGEAPVTTQIPAVSTEYVRVEVAATANGAAVDPTTDTVQFAFLSSYAEPGVGDWKSASWDSENGRYYAQCLVGPSGTVTLAKGPWFVWVKVTASPEAPVRQVGQLQIT